MPRKLKRQTVLDRLAHIAFGNSNDSVKLAFVDNDHFDSVLDSLDLSLLSEIKRSPNGAVEVKLVDRLKTIELLLKELESPTAPNSLQGAETLFLALDRAAAAVKDREIS